MNRKVENEMIKGPPTNPKRYLAARAARLDELSSVIEEAALKVEAASHGGERMLFQFLRYGGVEAEEAAAVLSASGVIRRLTRGISYSFANVADDARSVLDYGLDHIKYLVASAEAMTAPVPFADQLFAAVGPAEARIPEQGAEAYGYLPDDPANLEDEEYVAAMDMLAGIRAAGSAWREAVEISGDLKDRMSALSAARAMVHSRSPWRPDHGPVETLWHASIYARDIAENGFSAEKPKGRKGLGAFGDLPMISFTYERGLAENVAETLREIWDIVHGRISAAEIVRRVREEGIEGKCDVRRYVRADLDVIDTLDDALRLYWVYLSMSDERDNPVIVNVEELADTLASVDREDIGVLECRVQLKGDEEHLVAECEFRVPPAQVIEVALLPSFNSEPEDAVAPAQSL